MKKFQILTALFLLSAGILSAQNENYIRIIVPEQDSSVIAAKFQRLNGSTLPGSSLTLNGEMLKVYPSGAFAGFIELKPGKNQWIMESQHPSAGVSKKTMVIESRIPGPEKEVTGFGIEYVRTAPSVEMSLVTGELLNVRMKALSGCTATFLGNNAMFELPATQTGGIRGIYQGSYRVQAGDVRNENSVDFTLTNPDGERLTAQSKNRVSLNSGEFLAVAQTRGTFPYLNYGMGEDRLGGARISYLDTLVNLTLTGRIGDLYQVRLSESQSAYIPVESVRLLSKGTFLPYSLLDSWSVTGDTKYDYVKIGLSQRLPYISKFDLNPSRIIVDIFGAVSNTNWITQLNSTKEIKNVWYEQPEKNVVRITIELTHPQAWGYLIYYENNRLVVRVKQQPGLLKLSNLKIGIDAGHGGANDGALGSTGVREKVINLAVALKLKASLEKAGAQIVMTRQDDETLSTTRRWQIWRQAEPDIVLSLHCNSIGNSDPLKIKGTSTYYKYIAFRPLSTILYDEMLKLGLSEFGNVGSFNFLLNAPTDFPNTLIEMAFLSHPEDEMLMLDPKFQDKIVKGVMTGLRKFLKIYN